MLLLIFLKDAFSLKKNKLNALFKYETAHVTIPTRMLIKQDFSLESKKVVTF